MRLIKNGYGRIRQNIPKPLLSQLPLQKPPMPTLPLPPLLTITKLILQKLHKREPRPRLPLPPTILREVLLPYAIDPPCVPPVHDARLDRGDGLEHQVEQVLRQVGALLLSDHGWVGETGEEEAGWSAVVGVGLWAAGLEFGGREQGLGFA